MEKLLARNAGKALTHTYITQNIRGSNWENDVASLRVFMAILRKKTADRPDSPPYIAFRSDGTMIFSGPVRNIESCGETGCVIQSKKRTGGSHEKNGTGHFYQYVYDL